MRITLSTSYLMSFCDRILKLLSTSAHHAPRITRGFEAEPAGETWKGGGKGLLVRDLDRKAEFCFRNVLAFSRAKTSLQGMQQSGLQVKWLIFTFEVSLFSRTVGLGRHTALIRS